MATNRAGDEVDLTTWIGRVEKARDVVRPFPVAALQATLDYPVEPVPPGTPLPPLWHWLYFLPLHRQSEHRRRTATPSAAASCRRCRCRAACGPGSRFDFRAPLRVGDAVARTSTIENVTTKEGRTGPLVFVKVRHEMRSNGDERPGAGRRARHRLPRGASGPAMPSRRRRPRRRTPPWQRTIVPDDVLLFRYSALTFNGHRIHYDRRYVTEVEGYPGLVVHGPLIATLLLDLLRAQRAGCRRRHLRVPSGASDVRPASVPGQRCAGRRRHRSPVGPGPRGPADHGRRRDAALTSFRKIVNVPSTVVR